MGTAHTPAPWSVGGSGGFVNQLQINPSIGCVYGAGDEIKANAALVIAAPEMLAVLRRVRRGDLHQRVRPLYDEIQAVIAKATGATS